MLPKKLEEIIIAQNIPEFRDIVSLSEFRARKFPCKPVFHLKLESCTACFKYKKCAYRTGKKKHWVVISVVFTLRWLPVSTALKVCSRFYWLSKFGVLITSGVDPNSFFLIRIHKFFFSDSGPYRYTNILTRNCLKWCLLLLSYVFWNL
jgi:hypothetical protein